MEQQTAVIKAVCISEKKGEQKHPVEEIQLRPHLGIVGDAHAGDWHRQVSLLSQESVDRRQAGDCVMPREGIFAVVLEEGLARPCDLVTVLP